MTKEQEQQLKSEIQHIFDSGANEIRIFEMVKLFIDQLNDYPNISFSYRDSLGEMQHGLCNSKDAGDLIGYMRTHLIDAKVTLKNLINRI